MLSRKSDLSCFVLQKTLVLPMIRHYTIPSFLLTPNPKEALLKRFLVLYAGVFLFAVSSADARDADLWAIGGLVNYHQPTGPLSGWYAGDLKYGLNVSYVISPRLTTEVEYHYSKFRNSNLAWSHVRI